MEPEMKYPSPAPEMHSKGHKRMKIHFEGEDYDSTANSVTTHDVPKKKQEKATSRFINDYDPFDIPKLVQELDTSQFGSMAKEIEVLFARRSRLPNYDVAINHRLHDTCSEVPKNHCKEPSKLVNQQVTHLAHQNVINLEPFNGGTAIAPTVIDLSSDDEESGQGTRSAPTVKDLSSDDEERGQGTRSAPTVIDLNSNDEDKGQGRHSHIFHRVVPEPVGGLLMKDSMGCLKSMVGKGDIKIDKGGNVDAGDVLVEEGGNVDAGHILIEEGGNVDAGDALVKEGGNVDAGDVLVEKGGNVDAGDVLVEEDSCQSFQEKESNYATDTEDDGLEDVEIKAPSKEVRNTAGENDITIDKGGYVGSGDDVMIEEDEHQIYQKQEHNLPTDIEDDDMASIWKEMTFALECSKNIAIDPSTDEHTREGEEQCDHYLVLRDDIGYVCRICGLVDKGIETIFEFQYSKVKRTTRTYTSDAQNSKQIGSTGSLPLGVRSSADDLMPSEISVHPRHRMQMKPHQVEGFNFLCGNLLTDNPGGCILAHAPGSGKTFMIITFIQSFLARYPHARPLVILPKGILPTWKKEFKAWQVEDILLLDFYTSKAENRSQQLDIFRQWVKQKSVLFLGYKQFSSIVCDPGTSKVVADCQEMLLKVPSILILDEGHTPRNEDTDTLQSIAKVKTHLKVVLSGTLYQNHVKEVFNILNLVRPKFLRLQTSRDVVKRIMSKVQMSGVRKQLKTGMDSAFFDLVEHALQQKDENFKRKAAVIKDLREMTSQVLHYYKGDFLDELLGLVDFTVVLNLSARQKFEVEKVRKLAKFRRSSVGSLVYMHPQLKYFSEKYPTAGERSSFDEDKRLDEMLEKLNVIDGVKVKFFLILLGLCESAGEKLLVFSQYLLPLKLLERLSMKLKGWSPEKETFMVTGDSNSDHRERSMECFNSSTDAKVFFGSIKACGEGISLVGASRILILDVHLNPSVSRQAIGRAFRPGQKRKVYTYRLVASDSPEEEDHHTCFRKELISKMWFEWNENCGHGDFEMKTVGVNDCGDPFLESLSLQEDVKLLFKR